LIGFVVLNVVNKGLVIAPVAIEGCQPRPVTNGLSEVVATFG
jgi:hypothetical protein